MKNKWPEAGSLSFRNLRTSREGTRFLEIMWNRSLTYFIYLFKKRWLICWKVTYILYELKIVKHISMFREKIGRLFFKMLTLGAMIINNLYFFFLFTEFLKFSPWVCISVYFCFKSKCLFVWIILWSINDAPIPQISLFPSPIQLLR